MLPYIAYMDPMGYIYIYNQLEPATTSPKAKQIRLNAQQPPHKPEQIQQKSQKWAKPKQTKTL